MSEIKQYKVLASMEIPAHEYLRNEGARMHHLAGAIATGAIPDRAALLTLTQCMAEALGVLAILQERNDVLR